MTESQANDLLAIGGRIALALERAYPPTVLDGLSPDGPAAVGHGLATPGVEIDDKQAFIIGTLNIAGALDREYQRHGHEWTLEKVVGWRAAYEYVKGLAEAPVVSDQLGPAFELVQRVRALDKWDRDALFEAIDTLTHPENHHAAELYSSKQLLIQLITQVTQAPEPAQIEIVEHDAPAEYDNPQAGQSPVPGASEVKSASWGSPE